MAALGNSTNGFNIYVIPTGPGSNCTLEICPLEWSIFQYRPSLVANGLFIALFSICMILHLVQGLKYRTWSYMLCMIAGCIDEILGYIGRIIMYNNPFLFTPFLMQIICITTGPLFFCAAIYVTLSKTIIYLDRRPSRFSPQLFYWVFIPCDLISLAFQAAGGGVSSESNGRNDAGIDVSLVGLSMQVFTLLIFIGCAIDYFICYRRSQYYKPLDPRMKVFLGFLSASIFLILCRCIYRIDELSNGYTGEMIHNEPLFIALEGSIIAASAFCLNVSHPGLVFGKNEHRLRAPRAEPLDRTSVGSIMTSTTGKRTVSGKSTGSSTDTIFT